MILSVLPYAEAQVANVRETADLNHFGDIQSLTVGEPLVLDGDTIAFRRLMSPFRFSIQIHSNHHGIWGLEEEIFEPGQATVSSFADSLSLDGDTLAAGHTSAIVIGLPSSGQTHIYRRAVGGDWIEEQILSASDASAGAGFGEASLDGDRILIGAAFESTTAEQAGAAYIFKRNGSVWTEVTKLEANPPVQFERLGRNVALSGDLALLGTRTGARVFRNVGGMWDEEAELTPPAAPGRDVVMDGGTLGLVQNLGPSNTAARAFLYEQVGGSWTMVANIATSQLLPGPGNVVRTDIDLANGRLLIGTDRIDDSSNPLLIGAWIAEKTSSGWPSVALPFQTRTPGDPLSSGGIPSVLDVSASGNRFAAVSPLRQAFVGSNFGTVLVFETEETPPGEFCFGSNGAGGCGTCPCGNESPVSAFGGCLSSAGTAPQLYAGGIPRLSNDTLRFDLRYAAPNSFALLFSGDRQLPAMGPCPQGSGVLGIPSLDGLRCVGMNLIRHGTRALNADGNMSTTWGDGDLATTPGLAVESSASSGQTRHWQAFFREPAQSGCGTGIGTSQAISVTFAP